MVLFSNIYDEQDVRGVSGKVSFNDTEFLDIKWYAKDTMFQKVTKEQ